MLLELEPTLAGSVKGRVQRRPLASVQLHGLIYHSARCGCAEWPATKVFLHSQTERAGEAITAIPPIQSSEEDRYHTSHRLEPLLASLEARLRAGQVIYLHCWGGRGRAGTVGACLLARMYRLGAEEALDRVQRAYSTRKDPDREFIPTREYGAAPAVHICKPCFAQVGGVGSAA